MGFLVLSVGSNLVISKNPALALRLERVGAPVALFFAGKSGPPPPPDPGRPEAVAAEAGAGRPWSAMDGHRTYVLGDRVLIVGAAAAWAVALVMAIGLFASGPQKLTLAVIAVGFAALGTLPVWIVRRRRAQGRAWARKWDQR